MSNHKADEKLLRKMEVSLEGLRVEAQSLRRDVDELNKRADRPKGLLERISGGLALTTISPERQLALQYDKTTQVFEIRWKDDRWTALAIRVRGCCRTNASVVLVALSAAHRQQRRAEG